MRFFCKYSFYKVSVSQTDRLRLLFRNKSISTPYFTLPETHIFWFQGIWVRNQYRIGFENLFRLWHMGNTFLYGGNRLDNIRGKNSYNRFLTEKRKPNRSDLEVNITTILAHNLPLAEPCDSNIRPSFKYNKPEVALFIKCVGDASSLCIKRWGILFAITRWKCWKMNGMKFIKCIHREISTCFVKQKINILHANRR